MLSPQDQKALAAAAEDSLLSPIGDGAASGPTYRFAAPKPREITIMGGSMIQFSAHHADYVAAPTTVEIHWHCW